MGLIMKRESNLEKRDEINIFKYRWRSGHLKSYAVMVRGFVLISTVIVATIFNAAHGFSAGYNNEFLFEVLVNARLRETPSLSAKTLSILPGGFVVSIIKEVNGEENWYQIEGAPGAYQTGYIHKSLLKPYTFSYKLEEYENEYHKIKYFWPGESGNGYVYSQHHVRIYSKEGQFLSHLPRLSDCEIGGLNIIPGGLGSDQPFYTLKYNLTGGAHCCFKYIYLSKSPLSQNEFTIDAEHSDIMPEIYDATGDRDYRIKVYDWNYAYWLYSFGDSPAPQVVLNIDKAHLSVSQENMIQPKPTSSQIIDLKKSVGISVAQTNIEVSDVFSKLTKIMVNFIYSNNAQAAVDFLSMVWPADLELKYYDRVFDRDTYKTELFSLVKESEYFQEWMLKGVQ